MSTVPATRPLLSIPELCNRLGATERHIRSLVFKRQIPYLKVGKLVRFDPDAIDGWLDDHSSSVLQGSDQ